METPKNNKLFKSSNNNFESASLMYEFRSCPDVDVLSSYVDCSREESLNTLFLKVLQTCT